MSFLQELEESGPQKALSLLSNRFSKNRTFFQKNFPHLFQYVEAPLKEYELNLSAKGINILHKESKEFVYGVENGKSAIFNYSKSVAKAPATNKSWQRFLNEALIKDSELKRVPITGAITQKLEQLAQNDSEYNETLVQYSGAKQLPTTALLGILAGLHIEYMVEHFEKLHGVLIYEPNPEFFVLSTYFVDYEKLFTKTNDHSCYIVIGGKLTFQTAKDFFGTRLITNSYFRLEHNAYNHPYIDDAKRVTDEIAKTSTRGWGTYEDEVVGLSNKLSWLDPKNPKYPFLEKENLLDCPICVVGNGPSLNSSIDFLKINKDNFLILSSGTALAPLKKAGIDPDFHIEIERMDHVQDWLEDAGLGDTPLIGADILHRTTLDYAKESYLFIRTATAAQDIYEPKFVIDFANPLVGNAAFALALNFSQEIYLVGMDLGFKKEGKQHAIGSLYDTLDDKSKEILPTRGNLSNEVYTNSLMSLSKVTKEQAIAKKSAKVFNLSDGVFITGAKPTKESEVQLKAIDKEKFTIAIKSSFTKKDFFQSKKNDYQKILKKYFQDLLTIMKRAKINDKRDLFSTIDLLFYATTIHRRNESVTGTLMSGSLWHILNTIFVLLLRINRDNVNEIYHQMVEILEKELQGYTIE